MQTWILMQYCLCEDKLWGEFCPMYQGKWKEFHSFSEFFYELEGLLEELDMPQAVFRIRREWREPGRRQMHSLCQAESLMREQKNAYERGMEKVHMEARTFAGRRHGQQFHICIRYRNHASWQGEIRWDNRKLKRQFRSALELLVLLMETARPDLPSDIISEN